MKNPKKKIYPYSYDYWIDKEEKKVFAVVEYDNKITNWKHSNLYLISTDYHGNQKEK